MSQLGHDPSITALTYFVNNKHFEWFFSRDYRSNNNGNNGNNALANNNRDRDRRFSSEEDSYDSDESDDSQYRRNHIRTSNEALNQIIIFGLKKHITEADVSSLRKIFCSFDLIKFI